MNHDLWSTEPSALDLLGDNAPTARPMLLDATVMMVDDEPLMTDLIQAHLEDEGYLNFVVTNDPRETMSLLRCNEPGVLLLDLMMPGVSGFDLLTQIRADRELRYTPVIVLTAASGADIKLRALQLGATDFLSKPVDPSELVLRVRNTLAFRQFHERALNFDAVTGLPNQRAFERQLARMLAQAEPRGERVGLLRITVAECRQLRETIGQGAADQLMARLAQRLLRIVNAEAAARPGTPERGPTVARLGAEEFGLMLDGLHNVESAEAVARQLVRELAQTVRFGAHEVDPTPFVGIAISPTDGRTGDALLQRAALARSNTQRRGGAHYEFFSAELNARAIERLTLGSQLRRAVERGQLRLHYQPKVDITSQRIIGAEALVRWAHPEQGMVAPGRFIPLAEELGLINGIGDWVLARACHDCARWTREGHAALKVAINVSKAQLEADHLCMVLRQTLRDSGLDPRQLVVELTESMLMDDAQAALALMNEIKALGVTLSIDDFGTGYSSLNYLKRFPIDELKIDRSFVEDLPGGAQDLAIVRAIVSLGQSLGMAVVAEGVETEPQLKALRQLGCDTFQGFLFSRPVPEPEFLALLRPVAESAPAGS